MRTPRRGPIATATAALLLLVTAGATSAQQSDPSGYCVPGSTQFDPQDLERPDAPPIELPQGFERRRVSLAGFSTTAILGGPQDSEEAVVFMHGNPGNSLDFVGLLAAVPAGTRVIAFDILGFGDADKPYDFPYDFASSRPLASTTPRCSARASRARTSTSSRTPGTGRSSTRRRGPGG